MNVSKFTLAQAAAQAANAVPGVAGLYAGVLGEFSTYGNGERIGGVRVRLESQGALEQVEVRVTADMDALLASAADTVHDLSERVHAAVSEAVQDRTGRPVPVHVRISDVARVTTALPGPEVV